MEWALMLAVFCALLAILALGLKAVDDAERENRLMEMQLHSEQMYREALEARIMEMRRFRHDVDGLLRAIELSGGASVKSSAPTGGMMLVDDASLVDDAFAGNGFDGDNPPVLPKSLREAFPLVAAIIELKCIQCAEEDVVFDAVVADDFASTAVAAGVREQDVCASVQNLLQNAYDESLRIKTADQRSMSLCMNRHGDKAAIRVTNCTESEEPPTFRTKKADGESHGVGLFLVNRAAAKYDSEPQVSFDGHAKLLTIDVELGL